MGYTKENAACEHLHRVIYKSWTWARLTEEERNRFYSLGVASLVKGSAFQRMEQINQLYNAFLAGVGYHPDGWREDPAADDPTF